ASIEDELLDHPLLQLERNGGDGGRGAQRVFEGLVEHAAVEVACATASANGVEEEPCRSRRSGGDAAERVDARSWHELREGLRHGSSDLAPLVALHARLRVDPELAEKRVEAILGRRDRVGEDLCEIASHAPSPEGRPAVMRNAAQLLDRPSKNFRV